VINRAKSCENNLNAIRDENDERMTDHVGWQIAPPKIEKAENRA